MASPLTALGGFPLLSGTAALGMLPLSSLPGAHGGALLGGGGLGANPEALAAAAAQQATMGAAADYTQLLSVLGGTNGLNVSALSAAASAGGPAPMGGMHDGSMDMQPQQPQQQQPMPTSMPQQGMSGMDAPSMMFNSSSMETKPDLATLLAGSGAQFSAPPPPAAPAMEMDAQQQQA